MVKLVAITLNLQKFFRSVLPLKKQIECPIRFTPQSAQVNFIFPRGQVGVLAKYSKQYFVDYESDDEYFVVYQKLIEYLKDFRKDRNVRFWTDLPYAFIVGEESGTKFESRLIPVKENMKKPPFEPIMNETGLMPTHEGKVLAFNIQARVAVEELKDFPWRRGKCKAGLSWDGEAFKLFTTKGSARAEHTLSPTTYSIKGEPIAAYFNANTFHHLTEQFVGEVWLGIATAGVVISQADYEHSLTYMLDAERSDDESSRANMSSEAYDLKKSKSIGELYPVLEDAKGNIIDGKHRLQADPNWKRQRMLGVDTEEKLIIARLVSNWHRRQVTRREKAEWINGLAETYKNQGYKTLLASNEIIKKIVEVTGLSQPTVNAYLDDKYKACTSEDRERKPKISAHERIAHKLGEKFAKRHEEEVLRKFMYSPKEVREEKINKIISQLPEEERKKMKDEVKQYALTLGQVRERVAEIQDPKIRSKPVLADMFVPKAEFAVERICKPLGRFAVLDAIILNDLDNEQKEKVLAVLLESRKKIDEMVKAIKDKK